MKQEENIKENERRIVEYETMRTEVFKKVQSIVNRNFVEEFNHTFYCDIWKHGIPEGNFTPVENFKYGSIKADWLKSYLYDLVYDLLNYGCNIGIEKVYNKWESIVDTDKHFVRTDKFFGVFLLDYKMEQMFPDAPNCFKSMLCFTRLRIKLNSPNSEWIKII
jgi:hypothetical protein